MNMKQKLATPLMEGHSSHIPLELAMVVSPPSAEQRCGLVTLFLVLLNLFILLPSASVPSSFAVSCCN